MKVGGCFFNDGILYDDIVYGSTDASKADVPISVNLDVIECWDLKKKKKIYKLVTKLLRKEKYLYWQKKCYV